MLRDPHQQPLERAPLLPGTPQRLKLNEEQAAEFLNMLARWRASVQSLISPMVSEDTPLYLVLYGYLLTPEPVELEEKSVDRLVVGDASPIWQFPTSSCMVLA